jgi:hypothetical protein
VRREERQPTEVEVPGAARKEGPKPKYSKDLEDLLEELEELDILNGEDD